MAAFAISVYEWVDVTSAVALWPVSWLEKGYRNATPLLQVISQSAIQFML